MQCILAGVYSHRAGRTCRMLKDAEGERWPLFLFLTHSICTTGYPRCVMPPAVDACEKTFERHQKVKLDGRKGQSAPLLPEYRIIVVTFSLIWGTGSRLCIHFSNASFSSSFRRPQLMTFSPCLGGSDVGCGPLSHPPFYSPVISHLTPSRHHVHWCQWWVSCLNRGNSYATFHHSKHTLYNWHEEFEWRNDCCATGCIAICDWITSRPGSRQEQLKTSGEQSVLFFLSSFSMAGIMWLLCKVTTGDKLRSPTQMDRQSHSRDEVCECVSVCEEGTKSTRWKWKMHE